MLPTEKNEFISLLKTVFLVYGKKLDRDDVTSFWWNTLSTFELSEIKIAFEQHVKESEFIPRSTHILEYFDAMRKHYEDRKKFTDAYSRMVEKNKPRLVRKGDLAKQFDPAMDERAKANRLRIREMTLALTKKPGTGDRDPWEEAE